MLEQILKQIGREELLNENGDSDLFAAGLIDSMDVMELVEAIEKVSGKALDASYIDIENFKSLNALKSMLERAFV